MKKSFFLLFVLIMTSSICFGQFRSKVEERFELTSIAFMLAGAPEYNQCGIRSYERDIRDWFGKYETDKSIEFMRKLNREHAIGHNAISSVAARLQIKDGIVALHPDYTLAYICKEVDTRWTEPLLAEYIAMLNRFYKKSRFAAFYSDHGELYRVAQERMDSLLGTEATDWFERFYGEALTEKVPNTYISLVNGSSNYSLGNGGVLIGLYDDESGLPNPNSYTLAPLLHEWGHHFTAPIIRKYWPQMEKAAERIAPSVEPAMNRIGYSGAWTMTVEWLNNLFANMYFKEHDPEFAASKTAMYMHLGFIWMDRSYDFMDHFYADRERYPHIEDFMPQIVAFFDYVAEQFDIIYRDFKASNPVITNIYPAPGSDITGFDRIEITFSHRMNGSWGVQRTGTGDERVEYLFDVMFDEIEWSEDGTRAYLLLDKDKIEPGTVYGLRLYPPGFCSSTHFPLDERCANLLFRTGPDRDICTEP